MSEVPSEAVAPADLSQPPGLSQVERVVDTFTAPTKTFEDIKRGNRSWWLPFIILAVVSYIFYGAVVARVGIRQVVENQITMNAKSQERMANLTPEQREQGIKVSENITQGAFLAGPVIGLISAVVVVAVLLGTINFGFGGKAKFADIFAVTYYAWLPSAIKVLLGIAVMWFQPAEQFNIKNFAPTNAAALFLDPQSSNKALYAIASSLDVITIWMLVLLGIGIATVAGVKRSSGYIAVFGWWILITLVSVGFAAAFS